MILEYSACRITAEIKSRVFRLFECLLLYIPDEKLSGAAARKERHVTSYYISDQDTEYTLTSVN